MCGDLKIAARILEEEGHSLVVVRGGRVLLTSRMPGVSSMLEALDNNILPGSAVADKVMGRAAAMIAVEGEVQSIHTPLMSGRAQEVLEEAGTLYAANRVIPGINNRDNTGPCPIEAATEFTVVPEKAIKAIRGLLHDLANGAKVYQMH